ncbi:MAG: helix-turn-helix domain-containing protein [Actinobacteria bacterium]|nr:helix-turn-helix domain-containing protein [Actinomycetota bacterium]
MTLDDDQRYRVVASRDARFDGWFVVAVRTTGIYCRPSCPSITPKRTNVTFFRSAAAAVHGGYRACRRCRPDVTPGSPEWDVRGDIVGRAMTLIADGIVDRGGVPALARRVGFSTRQLHRILTAELGAGPLAIALDARVRNARTLIETTDLSFSEIAFAAGFGSIRQFNDAVRAAFALTPTELRGRRRAPAGGGFLTVTLPAREPYDPRQVLRFLAARAIVGVEWVTEDRYVRTLRLPHGAGVLDVRPLERRPGLVASLRLADLRDLAPAVNRIRRLFDLDADPVSVAAVLAEDLVLGPMVAERPGLRVPGTVDPYETAVRAVIGQQVSVAAARTVAARLVAAVGPLVDGFAGVVEGSAGVERLFPSAEEVLTAPDSAFGMPASRRETLRRLSSAVVAGDVVLELGADRDRLRDELRGVRGIGPWTADYVAMRCGDPDGWLSTDLGVMSALRRHGLEASAMEAWRPWRAYAMHHLWMEGTT